MKNSKRLHSVALVSAVLILFLILVSSTASAATAQSTSFVGTYAYVTNYESNTVSVINTVTDTVTTTIPVGSGPEGVAVNPAGKIYVANNGDNTVSVIDTATNTVTSTVPVGSGPEGVAVNSAGTKVYVTNANSDNVSVIDTATNTVTSTVPVGSYPWGVAVNPTGTKVYVVNYASDTVSVIDTATNTVAATVSVGSYPSGVAVNPDGTKVYVTNDYNVSVIDTATNKVTATVPVESLAWEAVVTSDGKKVYVTNSDRNTVSVIDAATNTVTSTVLVENDPEGIAVNPAGTKIYVANYYSGTISVIDTTTNTVTATVSVGNRPVAFGQFIGSVPVPEPILPVVNFSSNVTEGYAPLSVHFTDLSQNATGWKWNFGDGSSSTQQNPIHIFSAAGNYTVNLTVSNENGTDSKLATINVSKPVVRPVANFSATSTSGKAPLNVSFTDKSTNSPTSWKWSFGDGTNSTVQNPTHKYSKAGSYTVALTASNAAGNNTTTKTNYIKVTEPTPKPVVNFTSNVTSGSLPLNVVFTDKSTGVPTSWKWSFGDGASSTVKNSMHTYTKVGNYTVSLTAKNEAGTNTKTITNYITVKPAIQKPVAVFSATPTSGNIPLKVTFSDKSTGSPTSWKWSFGDGKSSTVKNPVYTYSKAGKYTVSLTVKNAAGTNTKTITNYIVANELKAPVAALSASPTSGKAPLKVQFTDKSTNSPTSWKWSFGDKTYSTAKSPAHTYSKAGKYTVSLTVKNAKGSNTKTMSGYITVSKK